MRVIEIIEKYLKENGYDGLCNLDIECACLIGEIEPCGQISAECMAGYVWPCDKCDKKGKCSRYRLEYDFMVGIEKCDYYSKEKSHAENKN